MGRKQEEDLWERERLWAQKFLIKWRIALTFISMRLKYKGRGRQG